MRIVPLGGLGEIGMNCLVIEQSNGAILVDCGITFPSGDLGIELYHPRFDYLRERLDRLIGLVLTHGHEDHIGAVPFFLQMLGHGPRSSKGPASSPWSEDVLRAKTSERKRVPIWAPPHALSLVRARLEEHGIDPTDVDLRRTEPRQRFDAGPFSIEPIRVTHSIADATALAIGTAAGTVVHTGDFKFDPKPKDGEITDEDRLFELGEEGVRLLLSDSTNIDSPGHAASETDVCDALVRHVEEAKRRVIVALFASNVHRLLALGEVAQRTGRRIALLGRSLGNHVRAAHEVGRLAWPSDLVVPPEVAASMPPERTLLLAGGTQAERGSALFRLSDGSHPTIRLSPGDLVLLSSRVIPGNDRQVSDMITGLLRQGVHLVTWQVDRAIHTSGHAHRDEQRHMLDLIRPTAFMPVHGTLHHLMRHAALARDAGVPDVLVAENGDVIEMRGADPLAKVGVTPIGRVATAFGEEVTEEALRERGLLGRAGVVFVSAVLDEHGRSAAPPQVTLRGVPFARDNGLVRAASRAADQAISEAIDEGHRREEDLASSVRLSVRRAIEARTRQRPLVLVSITRL